MISPPEPPRVQQHESCKGLTIREKCFNGQEENQLFLIMTRNSKHVEGNPAVLQGGSADGKDRSELWESSGETHQWFRHKGGNKNEIWELGGGGEKESTREVNLVREWGGI